MDKYFIVPPKDAYENRDRIMDFLDDVRDSVSQEFNFHYEFICGSVKCKMVAFTRRNNDGMNFDVDIFPDTKAAEKNYYSDEIEKIIYNAVSLHCRRYEFSCTERMRTIEIKDFGKFTCNFHIMYRCKGDEKGYQKFITYDNVKKGYLWSYYDKEYNNSQNKIQWIKENRLQDKLSDLYIRKLNQNEPNNRTTKDLYLEAVNDICNSRGYNKTNKLSVWNESEEAANKKKEIHHFEYVTKKEALSVRKDLDKIIELLHKELHNNFKFDHRYIGSSSRNMITRDTKGNTGYDFDVDIVPHLNGKSHTPKQIKDMVITALNKYTRRYGFSFAENSTGVITIKVKDKKNSKIKYSCDFAIVRFDDNGHKQFVKYDKKQNQYTWKLRGGDFADISVKLDWIKMKNYTNKLRDCYLELKNKNFCEDKHSRSIFAEAVNNICHENGYKKHK